MRQKRQPETLNDVCSAIMIMWILSHTKKNEFGKEYEWYLREQMKKKKKKKKIWWWSWHRRCTNNDFGDGDLLYLRNNIVAINSILENVLVELFSSFFSSSAGSLFFVVVYTRQIVSSKLYQQNIYTQNRCGRDAVIQFSIIIFPFIEKISVSELIRNFIDDNNDKFYDVYIIWLWIVHLYGRFNVMDPQIRFNFDFTRLILIKKEISSSNQGHVFLFP